MLPIDNITSLLKELEVEQIYFCSGGRNASFLQILKENFKVEIVLNEASAAFMALGYGKSSQKPVVVCTTSGTAVAECFPAMVEAYYSNIPLIIISADRPERLRFSHAPQAINQVEIFGEYARSFVNLSDDKINIPSDVLFPLHINIEVDDRSPSDGKVNFLAAYKAPLIIISECAFITDTDMDMLKDLSGHVYIECLSNYKNLNLSNIIQQEKIMLNNFAKNTYDVIIRIGRTPISKLWRVLDSSDSFVPVYTIGEFASGLSYESKINSLSDLDLSDSQLVAPFPISIQTTIGKYPSSEIAILTDIMNSLNKKDIVFVGNSMPIRYWQMIDTTENKILASRGANGIDGQIATAIGIARSTRSKVHCIVGDLTFLYDLGVFVNSIPKNLIIHVLNNKGGRIFEQINLDQEIILEHDLAVRDLIPTSSKHVFEYFVDNTETALFWEDWNNA